MSHSRISQNDASATRMPGGLAEVAALAAPMVLTQLSQTLMQVVDSIFVGRIGSAELAGFGFATVWGWTVFCLFAGAATGVQTFVAQAHGAGRERECGRFTWQGLWAIVPLATLVYTTFGVFAEPLLRAAGPTDDVLRHAVAYQQLRPLGIPALSVWCVLGAFFRGIGDARTPLVTTVIANVANALLAWCLVLGHGGLPAFGVSGAAIASSIAEWVGALVLVVAFARRDVRTRFDTRPCAPDRRVIHRFLRTSAPIGGQWLLDTSAFALFTSLVARLGTSSMAASQAMLSLLSLSFMQAYGLSLATATLVGRYKGAGRSPDAARSLASSLRLGLLLAIVVAGLFVTMPDSLLRLFSDDHEIIALGRPLLALGALFQLCDAMGIVLGGGLRGAGDTRWPFAVQTAGAWIVRLPLAWTCAVSWQGGVLGAWCAECVFVTLLGVAFALRWRSGAWRELRI